MLDKKLFLIAYLQNIIFYIILIALLILELF